MRRLFHGNGVRRERAHEELPAPRRSDFLQPQSYQPDADVIDAVNVALLLGQPLLLTGEPGTGKTQLAYYIAWELGIPHVLKFETKSNSTAGSVFYTYDALRRFQHAQGGRTADSALPYITYNAFGLAILYTRDPAEVAGYLPAGFAHPGPSRSVVLIDEVDKAPRDFPNDILNELDQLYFRVVELDNQPIHADAAMRPIVIFTSNSEKDLPDAFLRRCVFCHIPFPTRDSLKEIVGARLGLHAAGTDALLDEALDLFQLLRAGPLRKRPATAELLDWMSALLEHTGNGAGAASVERPLSSRPALVASTLSCLVKTVEDQERAVLIKDSWLKSRT